MYMCVCVCFLVVVCVNEIPNQRHSLSMLPCCFESNHDLKDLLLDNST